jgi:hypothetical protein
MSTSSTKTKTPKTKGAVAVRQEQQKELFIEQLKKTPIIQAVCEKIGITRTTYYRWHKADTKFAEAADMALADGAGLVNDLAESQLMTAIRDGNLTAIIFWLKHHHRAYTNRVELSLLQTANEQLTPDQEAVVRKALALASLTEPQSSPADPLDKGHE